jgi:uncharacterized Zn-binding protein involved in type VI secretion
MSYDTNRLGTTQTVAYTGTAAASTNAFGTTTRRVRVVANSACHILFAGTPVATANDPFLPANWVAEYTVNPGEKVSAIQAATNGLVTATAGTLWVTELD